MYDTDALKGEAIGSMCLLTAILRALPLDLRAEALRLFDEEAEAARVFLLNAQSPETLLRAFENEMARVNALRFSRS